MFPLIAISAFFIFGITFFVVGKDDFGIKEIKEGSNNNSIKGKEIINPKLVPNDEPSEERKGLVNAENSSEMNSISNTFE